MRRLIMWETHRFVPVPFHPGLVGIAGHMLFVHGAVAHRILFISTLSVQGCDEAQQTEAHHSKCSRFHDCLLLLRFRMEIGKPFGLSARECSSIALVPGLIRPSFRRHSRTSSFTYRSVRRSSLICAFKE